MAASSAALALVIRDLLDGADLAGSSWAGLAARAAAALGLWAIAVVGLSYGLLAAGQWAATARTMKGIPPAHRRAMAALRAVSQAHALVYGSRPFLFMIGLLGAAAALLFKEPVWLGAAIFAAGMLFWLWVRTTTPPSLLFLSTSDARSIDIHRQLKMLISPLRVLTLLDLGASRSSDIAAELRLDCLRTENDDDWWTAITHLVEMAPILVINADTDSAGVVREARHLLLRGHAYKTFFLSEGDARLLRQGPEPAGSASRCHVLSGRELAGALLSILESGRLPTKDRPVAACAAGGLEGAEARPTSGREPRQQGAQGDRRDGQERGGLLLEATRCSQCDCAMTIFLGVGRPGVFPREIFIHPSHRGCFLCGRCGKYYCWDCSDSRRPCACGETAWQERQYFPEGACPEKELAALL